MTARIRDHRSPPPVVRDHTGGRPTVRDHRGEPTGRPVVRDHRTEQSGRPVVRDHRTEQSGRPVVRDHRTQQQSGVEVRDHRTGQTAQPPPTRPGYVWNADGYWTRAPANRQPVVVPAGPPPLPPPPGQPAQPTTVAQQPVVAQNFQQTMAPFLDPANVNQSLQNVASTMGTSEASVVANMGPGQRDMYNQLLKDDPKQARAFLIQEMMSSLKLMGEILSNVSKTRSEIAMTFGRNSRA